MKDDTFELTDSVVGGDIVTGFKGDIVNITQQILFNSETPKDSDEIFQNTLIASDGDVRKTDFLHSVFSPSVNGLNFFLDAIDDFWKYSDAENQSLQVDLVRDLRHDGFCQALAFSFSFKGHSKHTLITYSDIGSNEYYHFQLDHTILERIYTQRIMIQFLKERNIVSILPFQKDFKSDCKTSEQLIDGMPEITFLAERNK